MFLLGHHRLPPPSPPPHVLLRLLLLFLLLLLLLLPPLRFQGRFLGRNLGAVRPDGPPLTPAPANTERNTRTQTKWHVMHVSVSVAVAVSASASVPVSFPRSPFTLTPLPRAPSRPPLLIPEFFTRTLKNVLKINTSTHQLSWVGIAKRHHFSLVCTSA